MQRRELDRDARALVDAAAGRGAADRVDRVLRRRRSSARRRRAVSRRLAQHVVASSGSPRASRGARVGERLVDRLAGDELLAHHAHRQVDALADHRLAAARDRAGSARRPGRASLVRRRQLAGDEQAPGRGVDEQRRALRRGARASRRRRSCRGSARRAWRRRECAAAPRRGTSAPRLRCELRANSCTRPWTRPARPGRACARARRGRRASASVVRRTSSARRARRASSAGTARARASASRR